MRFGVLTLFPELIEGWVKLGLLGKALEVGIIRVNALSPRQFAQDKYRTVDDAPYGGGSGMVMMPEPIAAAIDSLDAAAERSHRVLLTPQGAPFTQADAKRFAHAPALMLVCGRYQGVDERVRSLVDEEISLGDFVLNGGEVAAVAIIEATARLIAGVLGDADSRLDESHTDGLLQYPQYTRPRVFRDLEVPGVLLSGNHAQIAKWRRLQALRRTLERRPDLFARYALRDNERRWLAEEDDSLNPRPDKGV
jgi:tRNA (guanine37-N1)-methyltransferase